MNHHLADQLWEERDGILTWAMRGLQDYLDLGENFPYAEKSEELKARNVAQYCPEMAFVDRHIVVEEGAWISTRELRDVYDSFCRLNGISTQALNVLTYIENHLGIKRVRGRVLDEDGNERNCWHYRNLRLLWEPVETEENADEEEYDEDEESDE